MIACILTEIMKPVCEAAVYAHDNLQACCCKLYSLALHTLCMHAACGSAACADAVCAKAGNSTLLGLICLRSSKQGSEHH